jgi:hypothetical protein
MAVSARTYPEGSHHGVRAGWRDALSASIPQGSPKVMALALCAAVALALGLPAIRNGVFDAMSTDDAMRLVEVRDLVAGQGWFDLVQHRLDPPGLAMHWSRVIDAPLAALILLLRPLLGSHGAEAVTLVLWPTMLLGAALLLAASLAARMVEDIHQRTVQIGAIMLAALFPDSTASPCWRWYWRRWR